MEQTLYQFTNFSVDIVDSPLTTYMHNFFIALIKPIYAKITIPFYIENKFVKWIDRLKSNLSSHDKLQLEMANKPVPVGITRTRPRFDGESPL